MAKDIKTYELEDGGLFFAPNEEQTEYANGGYKYTPPVSKNTMARDNVPNSNRPVSKPGSGKPVSSKDFIERGLAAASLGLPFPYSYGASILGSGIDFYDAYNEKDPQVRNALLIEGTLGLIPYGKASKGLKLSKAKEFNLKNADAVLNVKDLIYPNNNIYKSTVKPAPVIIEKKPATNYSKKTYDVYHSKDNKTVTIDGKKMTKEQFNNDFFKSHPGANYVNHVFEHGGIYFEEGGLNQFDFVRNQSPNVPTNFEQRMYHTPHIDNEDGSMSSHKMMSWSDENGEHSAPTIVYQNGKLVELTFDEAIDYAYKTGEMKTFNSFEDSYDYANNGYKQNTPMEVFAPNKEFESNALYGGRNAYEHGGTIEYATGGTYPPANRQDSLNLYNNALKIDAYYNNLKNKGWYSEPKIYPSDNSVNSKFLKKLMEDINKESQYTYNYQSMYEGSLLKKMYPNVDYKKVNLKALEEHKKLTKGPKYAMKDIYPSVIDPMAPTTVVDIRIIPKEQIEYYEKTKGVTPPGGYTTGLFRYDPLSVKPWDLLTGDEKKLRLQKYGTDGTPYATNKSKPKHKKAVEQNPGPKVFTNIPTPINPNYKPRTTGIPFLAPEEVVSTSTPMIEPTPVSTNTSIPGLQTIGHQLIGDNKLVVKGPGVKNGSQYMTFDEYEKFAKDNADKYNFSSQPNSVGKVYKPGIGVYQEGGAIEMEGGSYFNDPVSAPGQQFDLIGGVQKRKQQYEDQLKAEEARVAEARAKVIEVARKAAVHPEYRKEIFTTKLGDNQYYCSTRSCEVERAAGYTVPNDVDVFGRKIPAGSKLPVIPGTTYFDAKAPSLGFEKIPFGQAAPGDRVLQFSPYGGHSMIYAGNDGFTENPGAPYFYYDNGSGKSFKYYDYPLQENEDGYYNQAYRYVGNTPALQNKTYNSNRMFDNLTGKSGFYEDGGEIEMGGGGYTVTRSNDRKGKTHKVTGPDGTVKYFGDSNLGQHPNDPERKAAFYARHKSNLAGNPYFRAFARKTWEEGGEVDSDREMLEGVSDILSRVKDKKNRKELADYMMDNFRDENVSFQPNEFLEDSNVYANGGMIKRADGSYSQRGLWDNIRANKGSGKKPTKEMLKQEKKIKSKYQNGGMTEMEDGGLFFEF